jgi:hypothetical protein
MSRRPDRRLLSAKRSSSHGAAKEQSDELRRQISDPKVLRRILMSLSSEVDVDDERFHEFTRPPQSSTPQ